MTFQLGWTIFFGIVGIIALLVAVGGVAVARRKTTRDTEAGENAALGGGIVALICLVLIAIVVLFTSMTFVGTRQIAVETNFGRPTGTAFNNGFHWKKFWTVTHEMDGAIQIDKYVKDGGNDQRITVRLGNSSTAQADVSIRWQMKQEAAPELYQQYKTFDNVRINLVERNLGVALNEVFASFDPLAPQNLDRSPLPDLAKQAVNILRREVGSQIDILDVNVPTIGYDQGTEDKINQLNQQRAMTSIALEAQKTAAAQAETNRIISESISKDPNVIVNNCMNAAIAKGLQPFGCWPGQVPTPVKPVG